MDNTGKTAENLEVKPVIYGRHGAADEPDEDFTVRKVSKKFIILILGFIIIPFVIFFISRILIPKVTGPAFAGVTLVYWGALQDKEAVNKLIRDFEIQHPNIKIEYKSQDIKTLGRYIEMLTTRINNGTGPDIVRIHNTWPLVLKNYLLPLPQDVVASSGINKDYFNVVKNDMQVNGAYYGLPISMDTLALIVNDNMLKSAGVEYPSSWDDLDKASSILTLVDDKNRAKLKRAGIALGLYDNVDHASDILSLLIMSNNVNLYKIDTPAAQRSASEALMLYSSYARPNNRGVRRWDDTFDRSTIAFADEKVAMIFGYSRDVIEIRKKNPNLQFSIIPVPHIPQQKLTIASYWTESVAAKTKHPAEAFEFIKYLSQNETLEKYYRETSNRNIYGELYPKRSLAKTLTEDKYVYPFLAQADYAVSTPFSSNTYDSAMNSTLDAYMGEAIKSVLINTSYENAIANLSQRAKEVFAKYLR